MGNKLSQPVELTDVEIDVVSGGSFVGVKQSGKAVAVQKITTKASEGGYAYTSASNYAYQDNYNTGSVYNTGNVS